MERTYRQSRAPHIIAGMFTDRLTIDAPKRTKDGYLVVRARAARTGVYQYTGHEIDPTNEHGLRDKAIVNVLRDENTVFDRSAVQSFIGKPVTDDHPHEPVTANNWKDHARGTIMGALRDGEYVAFDILLTDAATIAKVDAGKRELSNGYGAELEFGQFTASDGTVCDARQSKITGGNHVALVDNGRAGSACSIADAATCEGIPRQLFDALLQRTYSDKPDAVNVNPNVIQNGDGQVATKTITFDGLPLEVTDAAEAAITKLQGQITDAVAAKDKAETDLATAKTEIAAKDTEIATLKQAIEDAKVTPEQLRDAAKHYAGVCDKARALKVEFTDDADADAIMKAVVDAKMGDIAKDWTAEQVAASFAVLTKDAKVDQPDPLRDAIRDNKPTTTDSERQEAYSAMVDSLTNAWKPKAAA